MAMAKLALRTMPGIDRPALAALLPTLGENDVVMLDLGANTECDARNLVQFAIMGAAYSRIVDRAARRRACGCSTSAPRKTRAPSSSSEAAARSSASAAGLSLKFDGFIEADKLSRGDVDVVVTDGFSGNIALKAVEGTARFVADLLRRSFQSSLRSKFGFLICRPATELLRAPSRSEQPQWRGLSRPQRRGGEEPRRRQRAMGVANAVAVTARLLEEDLTERITADLAELGEDAPARSATRAAERQTACDPLGRQGHRLGSAASAW